MLLKTRDDNIRPLTVNIPPMNVVKRRPILSVKMPDTGDRKNVVPIVNEPTRAGFGRWKRGRESEKLVIFRYIERE